MTPLEREAEGKVKGHKHNIVKEGDSGAEALSHMYMYIYIHKDVQYMYTYLQDIHVQMYVGQ